MILGTHDCRHGADERNIAVPVNWLPVLGGVRARRLGRGGVDRALLISLLASLFFHVGLALVWFYYPREPEMHVFILLESGEEAVEVAIGGAFESAPSQAHKETSAEVAEKRFDPELEEMALEKPPAEIPDTPSEHPLSASVTNVRPVSEEYDVPQPRERRTVRKRDEDEAAEPETRALSHIDVPVARVNGDMESGRLVEEVRVSELPSRLDSQEIDTQEYPSREVEPELPKNETIDLANADRPEATPERFAPPERRDIARNRRAKKVEKAEPEVRELSQPSSPAMVLGGTPAPRGVRRRATPANAFSIYYPDQSRRRGESGVVLVLASINAEGRCISASVAISSGYPPLDAAAVNAVRQARYQPATLDNSPVQTEEQFEIVFNLR